MLKLYCDSVIIIFRNFRTYIFVSEDKNEQRRITGCIIKMLQTIKDNRKLKINTRIPCIYVHDVNKPLTEKRLFFYNDGTIDRRVEM